MRAFKLAMPLTAALMLACGSPSDLPRSSDASVSITPATATIKTGGSVDLAGAAVGFTQPTLSWWQQDQHDTAVNGFGEENCDNMTAAAANLIPTCRFGYLTLGPSTQSSGIATYHAPATAGTYHVTLRAYQISMQQIGASIEKRVTAAITVTP